MILVLDACTISNLVNVFQDDSLIKPLRKCFSEVHITKEVIAEVEGNKFAYLRFYDSREAVRQLISDIQLNTYLSAFDKDKHDCAPFIRRFAHKKQFTLKESDGEFHSTLLSLYLSRWGKNDLYENNNTVLLATDDARAEKLYRSLFSSNQIGVIIDSIDIIVIFHLRELLTKEKVLQYIEGIMGLYNFDINFLRKELENAKNLERSSPKNQLLLSHLIELISDGELEKLNQTLYSEGYKTLYKNYQKIKESVKTISPVKISSKFSYMKERHYEIKNDLVWDSGA